MAQQWYAQIEGVTVGPLELRGLRELAAEGRLNGETPVRLGEEEWTRASKVSGLFEPSDPALATVDTGSRPAITINPSMNDTTEWRMLADTAKTADVKNPEPERPLPRRTAPAGAESPPMSRTILTLAVVGIVLVIAAALLALAFIG